MFTNKIFLYKFLISSLVPNIFPLIGQETLLDQTTDHLLFCANKLVEAHHFEKSGNSGKYKITTSLSILVVILQMESYD